MARQRLAAVDRRAAIIDVAFGLLAERGFEGLRTRDVADAARINSATLHHYFSTKEHLVAALAERLEQRFVEEKAPRLRGDDALTALRQQFADAGFYLKRRPELVAVYRELAVRALRDAATRALVDRLDAHWRKSVEVILQRGKAERVFRSNLAVNAAASGVVSALWGGIALFHWNTATLARVCVEIENGLCAARGAT